MSTQKGILLEYFEVLRREAPVHWNELTDASRSEVPPMKNGFWVLTKHADIVRASKEHETFSSHIGGPILWDLEPDRLLSRFREYAGLKPKGKIYGGWESRGVSGHILGHYLSACAMMHAASGEKRFLDRVNYMPCLPSTHRSIKMDAL